jgi:hypothetical protein
MIRTLKELRQEMRRRMHQQPHDQHKWLHGHGSVKIDRDKSVVAYSAPHE